MSEESLLLHICAYLLSYPDAEWQSYLPAVKDELQKVKQTQLKETLSDVIAYIEGEDSAEYEDEFVRVFDFSGNTHLYLAAYNRSNEGQQADQLLAYKQFFLDNGFDVEKELPDYLPAVLELAATVSPEERKRILDYAKDKLEILRQRLIDAKQVQAFILDAILSVAGREERESV